MIRSLAFAGVAVASLTPGASGEFALEPASQAMPVGDGQVRAAGASDIGTHVSFQLSLSAAPGPVRSAWIGAHPLSVRTIDLAGRANDNGAL